MELLLVSPSITITGYQMKLVNGRLTRVCSFFFLWSGFDMEGFRFKERLVDKLMKEKSIRSYWLQKHLSNKTHLEARGHSEGVQHLKCFPGLLLMTVARSRLLARWTSGPVCLIFKIPEILQDCRLQTDEKTCSEFFFLISIC